MCQQDTAVIRRPKLGALSVHSPPLSVNPRIVKIGSKDPSMRRRQYRLPGGACIHIIPANRSIRPRYFAFLHQQFLSQCNEQGHSQSGKRRLQRNNVGCRRFVMAAKTAIMVVTLAAGAQVVIIATMATTPRMPVRCSASTSNSGNTTSSLSWKSKQRRF